MDTIDIQSVRTKIDKIDYQIHDLLMQRADLVQEVIDIKKFEAQLDTNKTPTIYRPAREAEIVKNILKRHNGLLPHSTIIGLWRFLIASFCALQTDFSIVYYGTSETESLRDLIRYYFGTTVKLKKAGSELSALHSVSSEEVTLGILPVSSVDIADEWWIKLPQNIYVSGLLPFIKDDAVSHTKHDYMIVSLSEPTPSDNDKTLFKVIGNPDIGRGTMINCLSDLNKQARSVSMVDSKALSQKFHLIEINGFYNKQTAVDFMNTLKQNFKDKILDVDYLGSYPAPISLLDYQEA